MKLAGRCDEAAYVNFDLKLAGQPSHESMASVDFPGRGTLSKVTMNLNFASGPENVEWAADMMLIIEIEDGTGTCFFIGGYNTNPATDCKFISNWPEDWSTPEAGLYTTFFDLSNEGISSGDYTPYTVSMMNGLINATFASYKGSFVLGHITRCASPTHSPRNSPTHSPHWLMKHGYSSTPTMDPTPRPTANTPKPTRAVGETAKPTIKPSHSEAWLKTHGNSASPTTAKVTSSSSHFRHIVSAEGASAEETPSEDLPVTQSMRAL